METHGIINPMCDIKGVIIPHVQGGGYVVAMVHKEGGEEDSEEVKLWTHLMCHTHLSLAVCGMGTGHSKDVHGEVNVTSQYTYIHAHTELLELPTENVAGGTNFPK